MPEHEREDGARLKEIVAWMNVGAALGAAALLGVGGYLLLVDDGVSPSGSTPSIESPEDAAPRSAADIDTRPPGVSPPAAERPTVRAAEDALNLARADRRRSAEPAAPRLAADTDARVRGASPPAAERPTVRAAEDALNLARADRRRIQAGLTASGLEPGPADGLFGAGTRSAIRDWQAGRGLPATGYLNAAEAEELIALRRGSDEGTHAEVPRPSPVVEDSGGSLAVRAEPASRVELDGAAAFPTAARAADDSPDRLPRRRFSCSQVSPPNPLFRAVRRGDVAIVTVLADLCPEHLDTVHEQAFRLYETPLSLAVKAQAVELVRVLLEAGADPNTITQNAFRLYETPLSLAVKAQFIEIVRILVDAGADPNESLQRSFRLHLSPLDIAIEEGYTEIANVLVGPFD
ncbi:MAG: peptidoglycan-binding protein [Acidobacteria bacterium]|nr:peptidoglycan-binding protein [Acidobacteriota bacterium]